MGLDFGLDRWRLHTITVQVEKPGSSWPKLWALWAWPLEASHHTLLETPSLIYYWLFQPIFFELSTKFGHSIPRPLDLDGHSVKCP
jgi:hypothetical protein